MEEVVIRKQNQLHKPVFDLFEQAPALIAILRGREGICELFNGMFQKLWGNRTVLHRKMRDAWPELEGQGYFELIEQVYDTGKAIYQYEFPAMADWYNNGHASKAYFNFVFTPYRNHLNEVTGVMIFGYEVTGQVLARKQAEENELKLKQLADFMPQIVWTADAKGKVDSLNNQWYQFSGAEPGNLDWLPLLHPDDLEASKKTWQRSLVTGEPFEIEYRFKDRRSGAYRWFLSRACPVKNNEGVIIKWFGTCTDIHEQKMETRNLEKLVEERTHYLMQTTVQLKNSNKDLEQYAYAASHDLQEPLRKIKVFSERIYNRAKDRLTSDEQNDFQRIMKATDRMSKLIDGILEFSLLKNNKQKYKKVNLNDIVQQVLTDFEVRIKELKAEVRCSELPKIEAVPVQMTQLFTNLLGNSLKFRNPEQAPLIHITCNKAEPEQLHALPLLWGKESYIQISFEDNGIGLETEYIDKIFEMFSRIHGVSEYEGSGIGLAVCRQIVMNHKGYIYACNRPEGGAAFHIILPEKQAVPLACN